MAAAAATPSAIHRKSEATYEHEALPDPSTHIRLLELDHPDTWEQSGIRCKLSTWPLSSPAYHAISYTWGDPTPRRQIWLGQKLLRVPDSSIEVLQQLAYFKTSKYYWIDAICIAQGDVTEKNGQVAIMGEIFSNAEHVLVSLDRSDDRVEEAMHMVAEVEARRDITEDLLARDARMIHIPPDRLQPEYNLIVDTLGERTEHLLLGFIELSNRPWFRRMWVVQELLLAKVASVVCGRACLPIALVTYYLRLLLRLQYPPSKTMMRTMKRLAPTVFSRDAPRMNRLAIELLTQRTFAKIRSRGKVQFVTQRLPLHLATSLASRRLCTDKRDTIYGMLSLIDWKGSVPVRPDYEKSLFSLAQDVLRCAGPGGMPRSIANLMLDNLGVDIHDVNMQRTIAQRSQWTSANCTGVEELPKPVRDLFRGLQLTAETCRSLRLGSYRITHGDDVRETRFSALEFQWHDWLLVETSVTNHGFIVRPSCGKFEMVGYAYLGDDLPNQNFPLFEVFEVFFDAEDFILCSCIGHADDFECAFNQSHLLGNTKSDLISTPICKQPLSSFAQIRTA